METNVHRLTEENNVIKCAHVAHQNPLNIVVRITTLEASVDAPLDDRIIRAIAL